MCVVPAVVCPWSPLFITWVIGGRIITADFTKVTVLLAANQMLSKQTCCFPSKSTWCIWSAPHLRTSSHTMTYWLICQRKWLNTSKNSRRKSGTYTRAFWVTTWPFQWTLGGRGGGGVPGNVILWETQRVSGWLLFRMVPTSSLLAFQKVKCHSDNMADDVTHASTLPTLRPSDWTVLSLASSLFMMVDFRFFPVQCNTTGTAALPDFAGRYLTVSSM